MLLVLAEFILCYGCMNGAWTAFSDDVDCVGTSCRFSSAKQLVLFVIPCSRLCFVVLVLVLPFTIVGSLGLEMVCDTRVNWRQETKRFAFYGTVS